MKNNIAKYFWSLNDKALAETEKALGDPAHPRFAGRAITLLSRCDEPGELFAILSKDIFIEQWESIRRAWKKTRASPDHLAWWDAVHQSIVSPDGTGPRDNGSRHLRHVGAQIQAARREKGWTQAELARRAGLGQKEISRIENGKSNITLLTLIKMARMLGVKKVDLDVEC